MSFSHGQFIAVDTLPSQISGPGPGLPRVCRGGVRPIGSDVDTVFMAPPKPNEGVFGAAGGIPSRPTDAASGASLMLLAGKAQMN